MKLTSTLQNHLKVPKSMYDVLWLVTRFSKDLYNIAIYIQRQCFFTSGKILSLGKLFQQVKSTEKYLKLPSDLSQQVLMVVQQNFSSFFKLLKLKNTGKYTPKVRLPDYLNVDGHFMLTFISRLFKLCRQSNTLRLSLGLRGQASTGT